LVLVGDRPALRQERADHPEGVLRLGFRCSYNLNPRHRHPFRSAPSGGGRVETVEAAWPEKLDDRKDSRERRLAGALRQSAAPPSIDEVAVLVDRIPPEDEPNLARGEPKLLTGPLAVRRSEPGHRPADRVPPQGQTGHAAGQRYQPTSGRPTRVARRNACPRQLRSPGTA